MGRTAHTDVARKYQIENLVERHHQILRLLVLGHSPKDIADFLGCTTAMVSYVQHGELGKRQLSLMRSAADEGVIDVAAEIKRLAPIALAKVEEILKNEKTEDSLTFAVSKDILDRAGFGAPKVIQGQFTHAYLTKSDIEELKERAKGITAEYVECIEEGDNDA